VHALAGAGVSAEQMERAIPGPRFLSVDGELRAEELTEAFGEKYPQAQGNERRWFLEEPLHAGERTWVLSKMWGTNTVPTMEALLALVPGNGYGYRAVQ